MNMTAMGTKILKTLEEIEKTKNAKIWNELQKIENEMKYLQETSKSQNWERLQILEDKVQNLYQGLKSELQNWTALKLT